MTLCSTANMNAFSLLGTDFFGLASTGVDDSCLKRGSSITWQTLKQLILLKMLHCGIAEEWSELNT